MNKPLIHIHIIQFILFIFANIHEYSRITIFLSEPYMKLLRHLESEFAVNVV